MATRPGLIEESCDFSLVLGGPLFQLLRKAHLEGDHLELLYRRVIFITAIAWLPLFIPAFLSPWSGSSSRVSFFQDVGVHARFLVALPVLIAAELIVHTRIRPAVCRFVERRIVLQQDMPRFHAAVESAKLRNSIPLKVGLLAIVYRVGYGSGTVASALPSTWHAIPGGRGTLLGLGLCRPFSQQVKVS